MKDRYIRVLVFLCMLISGSLIAQTEKELEQEEIQKWRSKFIECQSVSDSEKMSELRQGLINMSYRSQFASSSPEVFKLRDEIRNLLISIPGHARFFSDEYLRLYREGMEDQEANKDKENYVSPNWSEAESAYLYQFRTLMYLPSPETITVLGEMLKETWQPPPDLSDPTKLRLHPLLSYSIAVLTELKMRDVPERGPLPYQDALTRQKNNLAYQNQWRDWWAEVKSGKKTFSFKGQAVEYRFKPDGTWDTIPIANPPDDGPKPIPARQPLPSPAPASAVPAPQQKPIWIWLGAGLGSAFIGIMAYLKRKKSKV